MFASGAREVDGIGGHLGWLTDTLSPDGGEDIPASLTVRLRCTLGPWKPLREFAPDERGIIALGNGSQFNAVGQDLNEKAFFAIAVDRKQDSARQFGVVASPRMDVSCSRPAAGAVVETASRCMSRNSSSPRHSGILCISGLARGLSGRRNSRVLPYSRSRCSMNDVGRASVYRR